MSALSAAAERLVRLVRARRPLGPLQQRLLKLVVFPLFYILCFLLFVRLTFPYETLRRRVLAEFNGRSSEKRLEIASMSGSWLFGLEAEGVKLSEPGVAEGDEPARPLVLEVERVAVSASPFAALFGGTDVSFDADIGGGEVEGRFRQNEAEAELEVRGEGVDISGLTLLGKSVGLPLGGTLGGQVRLLLPERKTTKATGSFDLTISGLSVGDGKAKVRGTIALPKLEAGDLTLKAEVTDGRMDVSEFGASGRDLRLESSGKVRLREPFDRSTLDLDVAFTFKEAYVTRNDLTRSIFGSPDSKVPGLFDMDPTVRKAKGSDGFYRWRVTGLLASPTFRPGAQRSKGEKAKTSAAEE
jgi:type II secretion system protein N